MNAMERMAALGQHHLEACHAAGEVVARDAEQLFGFGMDSLTRCVKESGQLLQETDAAPGSEFALPARLLEMRAQAAAQCVDACCKTAVHSYAALSEIWRARLAGAAAEIRALADDQAALLASRLVVPPETPSAAGRARHAA